MKLPPFNPTGFCLCGCGQPAPVAKADKPTRGYRKGDFLRYITGHQVPTGAGNPAWKGGRTVRRGYVSVMAPDHPYADKDGYVLEHRIVAGDTLGRALEPHEHVHHINGDTLDNRPENLVVVTGKQHAKLHADKLPNWYASLLPEERRLQRQKFGRMGAEARWSRRSRSTRAPKPPKP